MGGRGAAEGCSALELPQIPDRPRRLYRRRIPGIGRASGYAGENRGRADAGPRRFRPKRVAIRVPEASRKEHRTSELTGPATNRLGVTAAVALARLLRLGYYALGKWRQTGRRKRHGRERDSNLRKTRCVLRQG